MELASERSFRTKTGTCVVHDDRLVLGRSGARGALANAVFGNGISRVRAFYGSLAVLFLALAVRELAQTKLQPIPLVVFTVFAILVARVVLKTKGLSAAPEVMRAAITRIEPHAPVAPLTRGHFIVHFSENGQQLRRLIILPGVLQGGEAEYARALDLLRSEGFSVS